MATNYRYYLGRISKRGVLSTDELIEAILTPSILEKKKYHYTFTNMHFNKENNYIFGRLVKFVPDGTVETIEPTEHLETSIQVAHKKEASSPFIIILDSMAIAYPTIWNNILKEQFENYFTELISKKYDDFFVSCEIEPIVDLRTFVERLNKLDTIDRINATVMPPNPLFGPVWKELKEYMETRETSEISINEKAKKSTGLKSKLKTIMNSILYKENKEEENSKYDITDAAILMAADGYGRAKVEGKSNGGSIVIKTKDNQKNFLYDREPKIKDFFYFVKNEVETVNKERELKH